MRNTIIILLFLFFQFPVDGKSMPTVTPEMFGAVGDGSNDDTEAVLQALRTTGDVLLSKTYRVDNAKSEGASQFMIPSGKKIFGGGRIITSSVKALFLIHSSIDVIIENITLDFTKVPDSVNYCNSNHGIVIINSKKVKIRKVKLLSPRGDGIYIGSYNEAQNHNHTIRIQNTQVSDFGRQGISVIEGEDVIIDNCKIVNTEGCRFGGIDIEPNHSYEAVSIMIKNNTLKNCGINTYRADSQIKRNNIIVVKGNHVEKQMHLLGGVGTHYCGISIQDAINAEIIDNVVKGFVGISVYNCDFCIMQNNVIYSSFRGARVAAVKNILITGNSIEMETDPDLSQDRRMNPGLIKDIWITMEISSSDGRIYNNQIDGRIWVRDSSKMDVAKNNCRGSRGAILLNMNRKGALNGEAVVKNNRCEASDALNPIVLLEGDNDISFKIVGNSYRRMSKGISSPKQGTGRVVKRNHFID